MQARLKYWADAPEVFHAMRQLQDAVNQSGLERGLLDLVTWRASQLNSLRVLHGHARQGCRANGETQERQDLRRGVNREWIWWWRCGWNKDLPIVGGPR
jgi:hypothetical protein